jgi:hypothetical protein
MQKHDSIFSRPSQPPPFLAAATAIPLYPSQWQRSPPYCSTHRFAIVGYLYLIAQLEPRLVY